MSGSTLFGADLARSTELIGSVLITVRYLLPGSKLNDWYRSTWLGARLFGSGFDLAQLGVRFDSVRFGYRGLARLGSKLSSLLEAWLGEVRGLVLLNQVSDRFKLDSRLDTRLSFVRSSVRHLGSGISSVFELELSSV